MQAVVINKIGGVEVLEYVHDCPVPERKPGQVLVKLQSSSVNPVDTQGNALFSQVACLNLKSTAGLCHDLTLSVRGLALWDCNNVEIINSRH